MKIGVFDSGVGGDSVAHAIAQALPDYEILLRQDMAHLPYGTKTPDQLYGFVVPILQGMIEDGCDTIVIACNTVTTTIISRLREPVSVPLIGMEPMVRPAAKQSKTGIIAVCATPATLASDRYTWLKTEYCKNVAVLEPDCSTWAEMIQNNQINHGVVTNTIEQVLANGADVIVLGCTHYHWIETLIKEKVKGRAVVIQPEQPVIDQLTRVIAQLR